MESKIFIALSLLITLMGCSTTPSPLTLSELDNMENPQEVTDGFKSSIQTIRYDDLFGKYGRLPEYRLHFSQFCTHQKGVFVVKKNASPITIPSRFLLDGFEYFGEFECHVGGKLMWGVEIKEISTRDTTHHSSYLTKIRIRIKDAREIKYIKDKKDKEIYDQELRQIARNKKWKIKKEKALSRLNQLKDSFERKANKEKKLGDTICNIHNSIGYVEMIGSKNIKVNVVGTVTSQEDYYLFLDSLYLGGFKYPEIIQYKIIENKFIWSVSEDWGLCDFKLK